MNTYKVLVSVHESRKLYVQAESEDEAEVIALDYSYGDNNHTVIDASTCESDNIVCSTELCEEDK